MTNNEVAEHLRQLALSVMTDATALEQAARLDSAKADLLEAFGEKMDARINAIGKFEKAIGKREVVQAILALAGEVL